MIEYPLLLLILFLFSMFFSGSESAFFSLSQSRVSVLSEREKDEPRKNRGWLLSFLENRNRTLSIILLGNLFVNISLSEFLNKAFGELFQLSAIANLVVITVSLLVFAEILPKLIALRFAERWSLAVSPLMRLWELLVSNISEPLNRFSEKVSQLFPEPPKDLPEEKLMEVLETAGKENLLDEKERKLTATVDFHFDTAYSVMIRSSAATMTTPRKKCSSKRVRSWQYE